MPHWFEMFKVIVLLGILVAITALSFIVVEKGAFREAVVIISVAIAPTMAIIRSSSSANIAEQMKLFEKIEKALEKDNRETDDVC